MMGSILMIKELKEIKKLKQGYSGYRPDIIKIFPDITSGKVLDVGCGNGNTGVLLKRKYPDLVVFGVESDANLAVNASKNLDMVFNSTIEDMINDSNFDEKFDVIILADVLEHLINPELIINVLSERLNEGGFLITSIPNIRHYMTFVYIYIYGRWPRNSRGIYDKTHLRFFTRKNIMELFDETGFDVVRENRNLRLIEKFSFTNIPGKFFDFWPFRGILTFQYIHLLKKS